MDAKLTCSGLDLPERVVGIDDFSGKGADAVAMCKPMRLAGRVENFDRAAD
jgi:hypothetical protein